MYDNQIRSDIICISEVLWEDIYHQDTLQTCEIIPSIDGNVDVDVVVTKTVLFAYVNELFPKLSSTHNALR